MRPYLEATGTEVEIHEALGEVIIARGLVPNFFETVWCRAWEDFTFALPNCETAGEAQRRVQAFGVGAFLTETLSRREYWQRMFA